MSAMNDASRALMADLEASGLLQQYSAYRDPAEPVFYDFRPDMSMADLVGEEALADMRERYLDGLDDSAAVTNATPIGRGIIYIDATKHDLREDMQALIEHDGVKLIVIGAVGRQSFKDVSRLLDDWCLSSTRITSLIEPCEVRSLYRESETGHLRRSMLADRRTHSHLIKKRTKARCSRFSVWRAPFGKPRGFSA